MMFRGHSTALRRGLLGALSFVFPLAVVDATATPLLSGREIAPEVRERLRAVADDPTFETWQRRFMVSLAEEAPEGSFEPRVQTPGPSLATTDGTWLELTPTGPPSGRNTRAIYDAPRDRMVVFGGYDGTVRNDVWTLTLSGSPVWSQLLPGGMPPSARSGHTAIYDPVRDRMVVFGGSGGGSAVLNDVWALTLSGSPAWSQLLPGGMPPSARFIHSAIYDPVRDRMVMFGGRQFVMPQYLNDVWALTLSGSPVWSQLFPGGMPPSARASHTAAIYDPAGDRMVVFGGDGSAFFNDVWALTLSGSPVWGQLFPGGMPPSVRTQHTAIYDPPHGRMVVFGGYDGGYHDDIWALTLSGSPVWSQLLPGGVPPSARSAHTAIYDPTGERMVVFGGEGSGGLRNDLWALVWGEPVDVGDDVAHAERLALAPPRPNPFRGRVSFDFEVPQAAHIRLEIYDLRGRRVKTVEDALLSPGRYSRSWDGSDGAGTHAPGGVHFVRLWSPGLALRHKFVLIR